MKMILHFKSITVDVPPEVIKDMTPQERIDYVDENWAELVDPSLPPIDYVETFGESDGTSHERGVPVPR